MFSLLLFKSYGDITPQFLYMLDEDLYRLGNATSPRLQNVRPDDVKTYERNGVVMVRADGFGISLGTLQRMERMNWHDSWLWKIPANFPMPLGLALNADPTSIRHPGEAPDHYFLCPQSDMPLSEYVALLSRLALKIRKGTKAMNIELQEWQARYLLEAIRVLEQQWRHTAADSDEDTAADLGNDMMRLTAVHDHLEREAVKSFGPNVTQFQGASPMPATFVNGEQPQPR